MYRTNAHDFANTSNDLVPDSCMQFCSETMQSLLSLMKRRGKVSMLTIVIFPHHCQQLTWFFNSFCIKLLLSCHFFLDLFYTVFSDTTNRYPRVCCFFSRHFRILHWPQISVSVVLLRKLTRVSDRLLFVKKDLLREVKKRITSGLSGFTLNGWRSRKQLPVHGSTKSERNSWVLEKHWQQNWDYWSLLSWKAT